MDEYEFDPDMDIGGMGHACTERLSEDTLQRAFKGEVEAAIPPNYRGVVKYICKRRGPKGDPLDPEFVCGWIYPGHQLKQLRETVK